MTKNLLVLFSAVFALVSGSLYARSAEAATGLISGPCLIKGQVVDAITKKPVAGVVVYASVTGTTHPQEVLTDCDGFYYFTALAANRVNLRFEKKGYQKFRYQEVVTITERRTVKINVEVSPDGGSELLPDDSEYPLLRILGLK